jgi:hypothetical protein
VEVELDYWVTRKRVEIEMARCATSNEARLVHEEMADRYCAKAREAEAASLVGPVVAQLPPYFHVVDDFMHTIIGDPVIEPVRCLRH